MNLRLTKRLIKEVSFGVPYQEKTRTIRNSRLFRSYREAAELVMANKKAKIQDFEKEKRADELELVNHELEFQNQEKEKRSSELIIANKELLFQYGEKEKRAAELVLANKELEFQNLEKEKRALELIIANKELEFQNMEKENRATELNAANQHLKLLETVITNTPDSIFILKADSEESARIIFVNPAFTRMTGYSESEVLNKSPFLLTGPNSDLTQLKSSSEKIKNGESCEFDMIQYNKDRKQIWVNFEITAVFNRRGKVSHFIVIGRDFTEKLKNLQALKDQNLVLKDIARMQSHNVRGPLARVIGLTNLLIDHFDEIKKDEVLHHLRICSGELDTVIMKIVRKTESAIQNNL